jgi:hypothetical protein
MSYPFRGYPESISERAKKAGIPVETFVGYRLDCIECRRPFRCFRFYENFCGCCRPAQMTEANG